MGMLTLVMGICFWLWYRATHPKDGVEVEIHSLPVDVNYVCIVAIEKGNVRLLDQYDHGLFSGYVRRTPDGIAPHPEPIYSPCAAIAWREAESYVVLWRDLRGRWYRRSIGAGRVRSTTAEQEGLVARKVIEFSASDTTEEASAAFVAALGFSHPERDAEPLHCSPGIRCSHEFEGRFDEAMVIVNRIELDVQTTHDDEAVQQAHELSGNIPKVLALIKSPSPGQNAAAAELQASCKNFSIVPGTWPVETLKVTAQWERLLRVICGNE